MIDRLPHRGRWALLDRVVQAGPTEVVTEATFTPDAVQGHFPGDPVVPGALLLEAVAQTLLVLSEGLGIAGRPRLAGFDRVRFLAPVVPPATVRVELVLRGRSGAALQGDARVLLDDVVVATARVTGTVG
ncbi:MAG: hypothetical protein KC656_03925 [Myxococcales bacterium]|nr:hypothetical protein [Myxococcales bacterium]